MVVVVVEVVLVVETSGGVDIIRRDVVIEVVVWCVTSEAKAVTVATGMIVEVAAEAEAW